MTRWREFLDSVDYSSPMTTAHRHIAMLCEIVEGREWRVLELGSHAGVSAAAMALAAPKSEIKAVDLCDTVPEADRVAYWSGLDVGNIKPVASSAFDFMVSCGRGAFDLVFHDAVHGPAAFREYLGCVELASKAVAIHDFEQLPADMQGAIAGMFTSSSTDADEKGRVLFVGWK
jgi:predicted O-methyltransferase YrrM